MVKKVTRRMRCEVQGCRARASYGFGKKGNDYPMCEEHFKQLVAEGMEMLGLPDTPKDEKDAPTEPKQGEEPIVDVIYSAEGTGDTVETPKTRTGAEKNPEYNTCQYCGEKFLKGDFSPYMQHVKKCKKEAEAKAKAEAKEQEE